jgi:hypothetical protein
MIQTGRWDVLRLHLYVIKYLAVTSVRSVIVPACTQASFTNNTYHHGISLKDALNTHNLIICLLFIKITKHKYFIFIFSDFDK